MDKKINLSKFCALLTRATPEQKKEILNKIRKMPSYGPAIRAPSFEESPSGRERSVS